MPFSPRSPPYRRSRLHPRPVTLDFVADRPSAGATRAGMRGAGGQVRHATEGRGMPWCKQSSALRRFGAVNRRPRSPFVHGEADLPLPKPVIGAILASKPPGIWRMSVYVIG